MAVLVYDGDCGICTRWSRWVATQCPGVEVVSHLDHGLDSIDKVLWIDGEETREGARAVAAVLRRSRRRRHRFAGLVIDLPVVRVASALGYRIVAANRSRISGWTGAQECAVSGSRAPAGASAADATTDAGA